MINKLVISSVEQGDLRFTIVVLALLWLSSFGLGKPARTWGRSLGRREANEIEQAAVPVCTAEAIFNLSNGRHRILGEDGRTRVPS